MDDEIWHPGNSDHVIRFRGKDRPPASRCFTGTYAARCCNTVYGGRQSIVAPHACFTLSGSMRGSPKEGLMKKTVVVLASMVALLLGACSQIPGLGPTPATGST